MGYIITLIGIPSAFLLHGYVGFIFGSVKANPWWSTPLMPIVFIFSAMVSGIAAVMLLYMFTANCAVPRSTWPASTPSRAICSTPSSSTSRLEMLDLLHRIYEADESFEAWTSWCTRSSSCRRSSCRFCSGQLAPDRSPGAGAGAEVVRDTAQPNLLGGRRL